MKKILIILKKIFKEIIGNSKKLKRHSKEVKKIEKIEEELKALIIKLDNEVLIDKFLITIKALALMSKPHGDKFSEDIAKTTLNEIKK